MQVNIEAGIRDPAKGPFNVRDYGAVGDGVTDNAAAIQATIDLAAPTNAAVYFPRGVYVAVGLEITPVGAPASVARVTGNVSLYGDGCGASIIKRPANTNGHMLTIHALDANWIDGAGYRHCQTHITGIRFDGTPGTATTGHSIQCPNGPAAGVGNSVGYSYAPWLSDVMFDGSPERGLSVGARRNYGFYHRVTEIFTNGNLICFEGNGDDTFVECGFGIAGDRGFRRGGVCFGVLAQVLRLRLLRRQPGGRCRHHRRDNVGGLPRVRVQLQRPAGRACLRRWHC